MNKNVLLIGAILAALAAFPANASDDDDDDREDNPVVVPVITTPNPNIATVTNNSTNTVDNVVSNVLDNHNTAYTNNTNTLRQDQAQTQVQDQNQQQEATSYSTSQGGNSVAQGGNAVANGGAATATGNGSGNSTTINQSYSDVYRERLNPVNTALGTNLTSGSDTCLGSVTAGVQTQIIGVSGGKTVIDENCVMIKNTKMLLQMGLPSAACFYLRQDPKIDEAMVAAGVECREPPAIEPEDVPVPFDRAKVYK
jgi:hypothetical protein